MDLLKTANAWLQRQRTRYAASPVTYGRAAAAVGVRASYGRTFYQVTDAEGFQVGKESWDFLVNAADLVIDERAAEPAVGDRILVGELDDALAYEVMNVDGERCWRWADSFRLTYRIHTKFVGAQPPAR
jgi:hypothetical protein